MHIQVQKARLRAIELLGYLFLFTQDVDFLYNAS